MEEKGKELREGGDWGKTERLRGMKNGFSVTPHEVKSAREFAGKKPGKCEMSRSWAIAEIRVGRPIAAAVMFGRFIVRNRWLRRVADGCTTSLGDIESQLENCFVDH